jgi:hypothetical protein
MLKSQKRLVIDYGGWSEFRRDNYINSDNDWYLKDPVDNRLTLDVRVWLKAILRPPLDSACKNVHYLYVRLKELFVSSFHNDEKFRNKQDTQLVEYAYAVLDLSPVWVQVGRHYVSVGKGLAYSDVNDAVQVFLNLENWRIKGLISKTVPKEDNIDTTVPGWNDGCDRYFYGAEAAYSGVEGHTFYSFFVSERDRTKADQPDGLQIYRYNAEYLGLGAYGNIIKYFYYLAEVVRETGTSYTYPDSSKAGVDAWAGIFELAYGPEVYSHPRLSCRFAFGTGDKDRLSVTDTVNGNISGIDRNFLYFGYIDTGYALAPRLSNLCFLKWTGEFQPFEGYRPLKNFTFKASHYLYYKNRSGGGIYDYDATEDKSYVGNEIDVEMAWQVLSDLNVTFQYGNFFPGAAYAPPADDCESYFSVSVAMSF